MILNVVDEKCICWKRLPNAYISLYVIHKPFRSSLLLFRLDVYINNTFSDLSWKDGSFHNGYVISVKNLVQVWDFSSAKETHNQFCQMTHYPFCKENEEMANKVRSEVCWYQHEPFLCFHGPSMFPILCSPVYLLTCQSASKKKT